MTSFEHQQQTFRQNNTNTLHGLNTIVQGGRQMITVNEDSELSIGEHEGEGEEEDDLTKPNQSIQDLAGQHTSESLLSAFLLSREREREGMRQMQDEMQKMRLEMQRMKREKEEMELAMNAMLLEREEMKKQALNSAMALSGVTWWRRDINKTDYKKDDISILEKENGSGYSIFQYHGTTNANNRPTGRYMLGGSEDGKPLQEALETLNAIAFNKMKTLKEQQPAQQQKAEQEKQQKAEKDAKAAIEQVFLGDGQDPYIRDKATRKEQKEIDEDALRDAMTAENKANTDNKSQAFIQSKTNTVTEKRSTNDKRQQASQGIRGTFAQRIVTVANNPAGKAALTQLTQADNVDANFVSTTKNGQLSKLGKQVKTGLGIA